MAANPVIPPDFEELAQASQTMTDNFRRLSNLPAVDGGAAIIGAVQNLHQQTQQMQQQMQKMQQQMQQMQQQMQQMQQQILQQMTDMEQRLATRISACNTNVLSRLYNSKIFAPDQTLAPLRHVVTNAVIDGFPATPAIIATLPQANVNDMLAALGEDIEGNIAAKRQRIRRAVGLQEIAA